jgi:uncharacterized repeat protein (TIGR03843 family)
VTSTSQTLQHLAEGEIEVLGLVPWSSNATLLVAVRHDAGSLEAIYKPQRGERPLWDFPPGTLGMREVAAYLLCDALGWGFVPPTVLREGPFGLGSVQQFVNAQEDAHFFTIREIPAQAEALRRLAAFDDLTNNADRKSGHCLLDGQGRLWAIDNALTSTRTPSCVPSFGTMPASPCPRRSWPTCSHYRRRWLMGRRLVEPSPSC